MPAWPGSPDHYPLHIAPAYIQPAVKCDDTQPEIGPLPIADNPLVVPEAPVLAAVPIPQFPAPVIVGTHSLIAEPCEPALGPETTAMDIPAANALPVIMPLYPEIPQPEPCLDEVVAIPQQPMVVPQPPELLAFVMPELPAIEVPMPEPCLEDQLIPVPEYVPPPMPLPVVEPVFEPEIPVLNIPVAPALPSLEMPVLPEIVEPEPCVHEEIIQEIQPIIPQAPELPAFVIPELPARVEVPLPEAPTPKYIPLPIPIEEPTIAAIPEPVIPELPTVAMPVLPKIVALPEPCLDEIVVPEVNYLPIEVP
ncbi:uncharacterized protein LOC134657132 [Cydia amplana]|uniref:uncharacterized protein LOC134657132 n=1 Tax=Cydia amplana TaxID=1869771 RepID=UPI002FE67538